MLHNDEEFNDTESLLKTLMDKGFGEVLKKQIDLNMLRKQCPDIIKMRKNLDERIVEVQLKQLEIDIKECMRIMQTSEFSDEVYLRYESLKKERAALLEMQTEF